jgi:hypothetical protein
MKCSSSNIIKKESLNETTADPIECFPTAPVNAIAVQLDDQDSSYYVDNFDKNEVHRFCQIMIGRLVCRNQ